MGFFGKKKSVAAADGNYVDMEQGLPVAEAVIVENNQVQAAPVPVSHEATPGDPKSPMKSSMPTSPMTAATSTTTGTNHMIRSLPRVPTVLQECPSCRKTACQTRIRTAPNWVTCLVALVLFFVFWPVCWIPFVTDAMKRTEHYCQNCSARVGTIEPFEDCCVKSRT